MTYYVDIQNASSDPLLVSEDEITRWVEQTLQKEVESAELTVRFVDEDEIMQLNNTYRKQNKTTNVLAFPSNLPDGITLDYPLLGDIIVCPKVLMQESEEQNKPLVAHWAHIIIHGVLHLLGYDHMKDEDARTMQQQEIAVLAHFQYANPYNEEDLQL